MIATTIHRWSERVHDRAVLAHVVVVLVGVVLRKLGHVSSGGIRARFCLRGVHQHVHVPAVSDHQLVPRLGLFRGPHLALHEQDLATELVEEVHHHPAAVQQLLRRSCHVAVRLADASVAREHRLALIVHCLHDLRRDARLCAGDGLQLSLPCILVHLLQHGAVLDEHTVAQVLYLPTFTTLHLSVAAAQGQVFQQRTVLKSPVEALPELERVGVQGKQLGGQSARRSSRIHL